MIYQDTTTHEVNILALHIQSTHFAMLHLFYSDIKIQLLIAPR